MPEDTTSSGSISIRPEITASGTNSSDSNATNDVSLVAKNEFADQALAVEGVEAGASFAPVAVNVNPTIKGTGAVSALTGNRGVALATLLAAALVAVVLLRRRRDPYGYY